MRNERPDRRVIRSRHLLQEALVELVLEQGYGAVTVQAVLDRADIGRATFYAHFTSKEDLLLSLFEGVRESLYHELVSITPERVARFGEGVGLLEPLFTHAAQHRRLYQALVRSQDGTAVLGSLRDMLATPLREHLATALARHGQTPRVPVELVMTAFVSAVLGVLVWWLEGDGVASPTELDRALEQLLTLGLGRTLGLHDGAAPAHAAGNHRARGV
jgi:AcrR family transcriptional regulator